MNKTELLAALAAASVAADPSMTLKQLQDLARANNVPTTNSAAPGAGFGGGSATEKAGADGSGSTSQEKPKKEAAPAGESDDEIIARKVAAGLASDQAREVLKQQRQEDAARASKK